MSYQLRCRDCPAAFVEMTDLLKHREQQHEPPAPRPKRKSKRAANINENRAEAFHA